MPRLDPLAHVAVHQLLIVFWRWNTSAGCKHSLDNFIAPISFEALGRWLTGFLVVYLNQSCAVTEDRRQHKVVCAKQADRSKDTFGLASLVGHSEIVLHACVDTFGRELGPAVLASRVHWLRRPSSVAHLDNKLSFDSNWTYWVQTAVHLPNLAPVPFLNALRQEPGVLVQVSRSDHFKLAARQNYNFHLHYPCSLAFD